jgi:MFS family permease
VSQDARTDRERWRAFVVCVVVASLTILDISKVNVGIPAIEESLGADPTALQLTVSGYALTFGLALVPAGRWGDLNSRRLMFLIGLGVFALASLACTVAPVPAALVAARLLQGVAAGILMPQVLGTIQALFTGAERGRAFGVFGAVIGLSVAFGPTLGGVLIAVGGPDLGWRLIFLVNVPLVAVVFPLAVRLLPRSQPSDAGPRDLDPVGIVLLGAATVSLMLPFAFTTGAESDDPARWWWLAGFAVAVAAFVAWERRYAAAGRAPVVDFGLFRLGGYRNGILLATFYFGAMPALFLGTTLVLQQGLGYPAVVAGLVSVPFALASAATSWWSGRVIERIGRPLVIGGLVTVLVGVSAAALFGFVLPPEQAPWAMAAVLGLAGAGGGVVIAPNQTMTLADVPVTQGGLAGSIGQVGQRVGTAVGIAIATAVFYATLSQEAGEVGQLAAYHDAYRNAAIIVLGFVVAALVFGLVDLHQRRTGRIAETA